MAVLELKGAPTFFDQSKRYNVHRRGQFRTRDAET
jgi:hypothetical protein